MNCHTLLSTLAATGLLLVAMSPASAHELRPELSVGATDNRENSGIHQFDWPTDSPVALPVRSSAKALPTLGGVDFRTAVDAPVYAAAGGTVISAGPEGVVVHHGKNLRSSYSHIRHLKVSVGQKVQVRDVLGHVDAPKGRLEQAHFHFSVNQGSQLVNPVDYLPAVDPLAE